MSMKYEKEITSMADSIMEIWYDYENDHRFLQITDDGVKLNDFECCEQRAVTIYGALKYTYETAENKFHKTIILLAFGKAMETITKNEDKLAREYPQPYIACIAVIVDALKKLSRDIEEG